MAKKAIGEIANAVVLARLQSEKESILRAAMNVEGEYQLKNAAKAVKKSQEALDTIKKWASTIATEGKFNSSKLSLAGIVDHDYKNEGVKEEYEKNLKLLQRISGSGDTIINDVANRTNSFKQMPNVYSEYTNVVANLIKEVEAMGIEFPPIKKNKMVKMPDIFPSRNEMIKLNSKIRAIKSPYTLVEDLSKGIFNPSNAKIVESIYPATTQKIKQIITEKIMNSENASIGYQERLKLSSFLGINLDESLNHIAIFAENSQVAHNQELNQEIRDIKLNTSLQSPAQSIGVRT